MIDAKTRKREWYERNRESEQIRIRTRAQQMKANLVLAMGGKCADCGIIGPSEIYDFDHKNPDEKTSNVCTLLPTSSFERILDEASKCELVCANCHRIRSRNSPDVARKHTAAQKARRSPVPAEVTELGEQLAEKRAISVMWRASEAARRAKERQTPAMKERAEDYAKWEAGRDERLGQK